MVCDDFGIDGFLSLSSLQIYRNYCAETLQTPTFLALIVGEGMKGTGEIVG